MSEFNKIDNVLKYFGFTQKQLYISITGTMSQDFLLKVFSWIIFLQAPENNIRGI